MRKQVKCLINARTREIIKKKHGAWEDREEATIQKGQNRAHCRLRNRVQKATRYQQQCKEKEVVNNTESNPKKFWQYINKRTKNDHGYI